MCCFDHILRDCPLIRTVIAVCGDGIKDGYLLIKMTCLACRCRSGVSREHDCTSYYCEDESLHIRESCVHCLSVCFCPLRTFDEVCVTNEKGGPRYVRVEHSDDEDDEDAFNKLFASRVSDVVEASGLTSKLARTRLS